MGHAAACQVNQKKDVKASFHILFALGFSFEDVGATCGRLVGRRRGRRAVILSAAKDLAPAQGRIRVAPRIPAPRSVFAVGAAALGSPRPLA